ncbi:hypothetical protein ABZ917_23685 [Nonomuraea wenchangensis]
MFVPSLKAHSSSRRRSTFASVTGREATEVNSPVNVVAWSTFLIRSSRSITPQRRDADPRLALPPGDAHSARRGLLQALVQPVQRRHVPPSQIGDEVGRVAGLGEGFVIHIPVVLEVGGQSASEPAERLSRSSASITGLKVSLLERNRTALTLPASMDRGLGSG